MTQFEAPEPDSSLGEMLLAGVRNLWGRVHAIEAANDRTRKVVDHQGHEIEQIRAELATLKSQIRGLKISRGHQKAKNARLSQQLAEAESLLPEIEQRLN